MLNRISSIKKKLSPDSIKYAKNTIWSLVEKVLRLVAQFFVGVLVARYLEPESYGILQYGIAFVFLYGAFASLGLREISMRELVGKESDDVTRIIGSTFFLRIFGAVAAILFISFIAFLLVNGNSDSIRGDAGTIKLYIFILSLGILGQSLDVIESFFRARAESKYITYSHTIAIIISSIVKIVLVLLGEDLFYFVLIYCFDMFGYLLPQIFFFRKKGFKVTAWRFDRILGKKLFLNSYPLMLSAIMVNIYMSIDQILIPMFLPYEGLGYYSSAVKILSAFNFLPVAIGTALFPQLVEAKHDNSLLKSRLLFLYALIFWLSILITLFLFFFSELIIIKVYTETYAEAIDVLRVSAFSVTATFLGVATEQFLIAKDFIRISFFRTFIGAVVNIILNIVWIPQFGILGAAYATIVSYYLATIALLFLFKETRYQMVLLFKSMNPVYVINLIRDLIKKS